MRRLFPLLIAITTSCSPCQQTGVVYPSTACVIGSSSCIGGRPYSCGGGSWRPVGSFTCAELNSVCCVDANSHVHACVTQNRCLEVGGS